MPTIADIRDMPDQPRSVEAVAYAYGADICQSSITTVDLAGGRFTIAASLEEFFETYVFEHDDIRAGPEKAERIARLGANGMALAAAGVRSNEASGLLSVSPPTLRGYLRYFSHSLGVTEPVNAIPVCFANGLFTTIQHARRAMPLTRKEREITKCFDTGMPIPEITATLLHNGNPDASPGSTRVLLSKIYTKYNVGSFAAAVTVHHMFNNAPTRSTQRPGG